MIHCDLEHEAQKDDWSRIEAATFSVQVPHTTDAMLSSPSWCKVAVASHTNSQTKSPEFRSGLEKENVRELHHDSDNSSSFYLPDLTATF